MPENFERSAVHLYRKIGQEPFVLAVGMCVCVCVCVCVYVCEEGGGDTNYMLMI